MEANFPNIINSLPYAGGGGILGGEVISDLTTQIIKSVYPVGSIYSSTENTSPATLFGFGTWEQIKDRFLLAAGDTYEAGSTGGAANHTLTVDEMPSHSHTFTGSAVNTGNNSVGHTHTYTDYYATTTGSTAITEANLRSHNHGGSTGSTNFTMGVGKCVYSSDGNTYPDIRNSGGGTTGNHSHTISSTGSSTGHTHSGANTYTTKTSNGISANHTHSVTAKGSNSNTGGGSAFSVMPPYLAVYMWKRTA